MDSLCLHDTTLLGLGSVLGSMDLGIGLADAIGANEMYNLVAGSFEA